jgi:hypothetical protein
VPILTKDLQADLVLMLELYHRVCKFGALTNPPY